VKHSPAVPTVYGGKDLWKRNAVDLEWKSEGMMDAESSEDKKDNESTEDAKQKKTRAYARLPAHNVNAA